MHHASSLIALAPTSPSFSSYSSESLAEIAARVVQEFSNDSHPQSESSNFFSWEEEETETHQYFPAEEEEEREENIDEYDGNDNDEEEEEEGEFEFAFVCRETGSSPISADEIFYNGKIRPLYPLFNTDLLLNQEQSPSTKPATPSKSGRSPLRKLFREERETTTNSSCSSSSEAEELESVPEGTYCVWTPKKEGNQSTERCKKSNSTGSSKRWKFRDLLYRSNSDGKDTFVFLAPSNKRRGQEQRQGSGRGDEAKEKEVKGIVAGHYAKNRAMKEGDKRRSFLPYRQDLVGLFSNGNGVGRNLHRF